MPPTRASRQQAKHIAPTRLSRAPLPPGKNQRKLQLYFSIESGTGARQPRNGSTMLHKERFVGRAKGTTEPVPAQNVQTAMLFLRRAPTRRTFPSSAVMETWMSWVTCCTTSSSFSRLTLRSTGTPMKRCFWDVSTLKWQPASDVRWKLAPKPFAGNPPPTSRCCLARLELRSSIVCRDRRRNSLPVALVRRRKGGVGYTTWYACVPPAKKLLRKIFAFVIYPGGLPRKSLTPKNQTTYSLAPSLRSAIAHPQEVV